MSRWKNYALWAAIFAFLPILAQACGFNFLPENYEQVVSGILGILVLGGIISNPTTKNQGFFDDDEK